MSLAEQLDRRLSTFRPLTTDQVSFLRSLFLSFSTNPQYQGHTLEFLHKTYGDIPSSERGKLGLGIAQLLEEEEKRRTLKQQVNNIAAALNAGTNANSSSSSSAAAALASSSSSSSSSAEPRITWQSFKRVCHALGLHLSDKRGQQSIKTFASSDPVLVSLPAARPAANPSNPSASSSPDLPTATQLEYGLTFDDFMIFYAQLSKQLSATQEMKEVWRLLDDDLDGWVPLQTLRNVMIGLEFISPSNTAENSEYYYQRNYQYHFSDAEKAMSKEELVDHMLAQHFTTKNVARDKINFQEFVEFMYA